MRALWLVAIIGCSCVPIYTTINPATGGKIRWPSEWNPTNAMGIRGDVLPAMQAALRHHLRYRLQTSPVNPWEEAKCEDSARAMDVSFIVDDEQHLVFVQIDEAPEKRCVDPPTFITDSDGRTAIVIRRPLAPMKADGLDRYAVTFDGKVLDAYVQGYPEIQLRREVPQQADAGMPAQNPPGSSPQPGTERFDIDGGMPTQNPPMSTHLSQTGGVGDR